jgi:hypothetical protein
VQGREHGEVDVAAVETTSRNVPFYEGQASMNAPRDDLA